MLSLWANWLVTKFGLNSLKRYLWPVLYVSFYFITTCPFGQVKYKFHEKHLPEWHYYLPQIEKSYFLHWKLYVLSSQYSVHFQPARFGQLLFLGLSKCLPESDFYLPRAIGQVLM